METPLRSKGIIFEAPAGSTIEVILDDFQRGVTNEGCFPAGVEIKTGEDKRRTGYR